MDDLISRQAAIDALEREKTYCTAFRDGYAPINVFEKYNAGLTDGIKALRNLPSAQQWIPCSERLPVEGESVLLCDRGGSITLGRLVRTDEGYKWDIRTWWSDIEDGDAWMPLPEPYKRNDDDGVN